MILSFMLSTGFGAEAFEFTGPSPIAGPSQERGEISLELKQKLDSWLPLFNTGSFDSQNDAVGRFLGDEIKTINPEKRKNAIIYIIDFLNHSISCWTLPPDREITMINEYRRRFNRARNSSMPEISMPTQEERQAHEEKVAQIERIKQRFEAAPDRIRESDYSSIDNK